MYDPHTVGWGYVPAGRLVDNSIASPPAPPPHRLPHGLLGKEVFLLEAKFK
jgi:hypothetical protein